jgi:hypothetical protein
MRDLNFQNSGSRGRYMRQGLSTRRLASSITGKYSCGNTCHVLGSATH